MALPVDVSSIEVLRRVREALLLFADDAKGALGAMDGEIRRCVHWLTHDQRIAWQAEIKRRSDRLAEAKTELHRKQISKMHGQKPHDAEQREAVREAKRSLEEAEEKLEAVKRWLPVLEQAVMEYDSQSRPFGDVLEFELGGSVELLDRMIDALEEYTRLQAPETRMPASPPPSMAQPVPAAPAMTKPDDETDKNTDEEVAP